MNKPEGEPSYDEWESVGKQEPVSIDLQLKLLVSHDPEIDEYVSCCPALELYSQGTTREHALNSIHEAITMFLRNCHERGTLNQVLHDAGFVAHACNHPQNPRQLI